MSHDIEAAWASTEVANLFMNNPDCFFSNIPTNLTAYAGREGRTEWPITDGIVKVESNGIITSQIAVEYKRRNEGLHGILTALGQAHAYIRKGYSGSVIVIPRSYDTHECPGDYIKNVIDNNSPEIPIGVLVYNDPDIGQASPFRGRIECVRNISIDLTNTTQIATQTGNNRVKTQWAHLREGSSDADAFFRYLQIAKGLAIGQFREPSINICPELTSAVESLHPGANPIKYLSNTAGDTLQDYSWRHFWFKFICYDEALPIWNEVTDNTYRINNAATKIILSDGVYKNFFSARADSIKTVLINKLNSNEIDEETAWKLYAKNLRARAHSYREDIDSGLEHLGFLQLDGKPSDLGYRFVDACERTGDSYQGTPKLLLGAAILQNGQLGALLHYIYRLSEDKFQTNPLEFYGRNDRDRIVFNQEQYLNWLENELANTLRVIHKVTLRGGTQRKPLQAELAILRKFDFVRNFRTGVGLEINWPIIQDYMKVDI